MKRIPVSNNFYLDELVDPVTYFTAPDNGISLLDPKMIDCTQLLRTLLGSPLTVNNWWNDLDKIKGFENDYSKLIEFQKWIDDTRGVYQWSGYRSDLCTIGAKFSKHRKGEASDPKGDEDRMYKIVEDHSLLFYGMGLRRLEDPKITNGWLHMDTSNSKHKSGRIRVVDRANHVRDIFI